MKRAIFIALTVCALTAPTALATGGPKDQIFLPGMPNATCVVVRELEQSDRVEVLCTWGDGDDAGLKIIYYMLPPKP
jgi:hypothetical protein